MDQQQWDAMDDYLCSKTRTHDDALDAALAASTAAGLPAINVAPNQGKLLLLLAKLRGARRILEIGTLGGYSSIWLARALPAGGELVTLEFEPHHAEVARANLARAGVADRASVIVGPAVESLQAMVRAGAAPFDFVFIDADKKSYPDYLRLVLELSRPGTVIVGDNVIRRGRIADAASADPDVIGIRAFFDLLEANTRLESTAVQTVGSKGWDGFLMSIVGE
jgi:predicted O-methyltransferase YrrM